MSRASVTCLLGVEQGGDVHLDKMVDVPVVVHARGHGPDSAVPGQGCCCRQVLMVPDVQKTFGGAADAVLRSGDVPVTIQRFWRCVWRWGG